MTSPRNQPTASGTRQARGHEYATSEDTTRTSRSCDTQALPIEGKDGVTLTESQLGDRVADGLSHLGSLGELSWVELLAIDNFFG
jgi:hypothetical protein